MSNTALSVTLANLALIGALPWVFFTREQRRFGVLWFVTAAPFALAAGCLLLGAGGVLRPAWRATEPLGALLSAGSLALIGLTAGVHRRPLALWHQQHDAPQGIVQCGPYSRVRHPFYSAFLLALAGAACVLPHVATLLILLAGAALLSWTARREERRLCASPFGADYAAYMLRTGRFLPRRSA
jgi:protein-S-isoprenylcysteine O-methyltransferase Ste14